MDASSHEPSISSRDDQSTVRQECVRYCFVAGVARPRNHYRPRIDVFWNGSLSLYWHHQLRTLVATLVFNQHHVEAMLVECEQQNSIWLLECLRPMAMLRNIGLIHFRSTCPILYPYFRFLEARMMGNRALPFGNSQQFRIQTEPWRPELSYRHPRGASRVAPPRSTDMVTGEGVAKSEEEMEAMAETLYESLEIESRF